METIVIVAQVMVALGILNVWLLRTDKATDWRGGDAGNMREEFAVYGLPAWSVYVVGSLKVLLALLLFLGIWVPVLTGPAATALGLLMLGAVAMHVKVGDPLLKAVPAMSVLLLCVLVAAV